VIKAITAILTIAVLTGCYGPKVANKQHGRAVATYPAIGADYCARVYPPDTTFRPGDTITVLDTLYVGGDVHFDTVYSQRRDTVYITRYVQGAHTIERQYIRDTVVTIDRAALDAANIDRKKAVDLLAGETLERKKYQKQARTRLWILIAIGAVAGGWIVWRFRKR
jgi:hypothetical protein